VNPNERLKKARKYSGLTQEKFGVILGLKQSQIKDIEIAKQKVSPELADLIEINFSINGWWLLTGKGNMLLEDESSNPLPIPCQHLSDDKSSISLNYYPNIVTAAGYSDIDTSNVQPQTMTLDRRFCQEVLNIKELESLDVIKVSGDSMEPYVYNGELVVIQRHEKAMDGETIIAKVNGHIYIKRYHTDPFGRWVKLISDNDPSLTIEIAGDDLQYFSIVGIIRAKVKAF